ALGVYPLHPQAWHVAQSRLRELVSDPAGVRAAEPKAIARLVEGLMFGGFAMQAAKSSRPASGAEHQFSHLWDMQHHTFNGIAPSHGFKVGIGVLASLALQEYLLAMDVNTFDIETAVDSWPTFEELERKIRLLFDTEAL